MQRTSFRSDRIQWVAVLLAAMLAISSVATALAQSTSPLAAPSATVSHRTYLSESGAAALTVRWAAVAGATSYEVKSTSGGASATLTTQQLYVDFLNLPGGTEYTFQVRAQGTGGPSDWSSPVSKTTPLASPDGLMSEAVTDTSVTVTWRAVAGATSYEVKQGTSGTASAASGLGAKHTFSDLTANTEYTLYVRAKKGAVESPWAAPIIVKTAPAAPGGLDVTATSSSLTLSWGAVTDAAGYEVRLGENGLVATAPSDTSHTINGLAAGTQYTLYVRTKNRNGTSTWASTSAATMLPAPTGLSATKVIFWTTDDPTPTHERFPWVLIGQATLSWHSVASATSYEVTAHGRRNSRVVVLTATTSASSTSHTFTNLTLPLDAWSGWPLLRVRARNSTGTSVWTSIQSGGFPAIPSGASVTKATSSSLTLSWRPAAWVPRNTSPIYEVKIGTSGSLVEIYNGGINDSHRFTGLTPNTEYTLFVRSSLSAASGWCCFAASSGKSPWLSVRARTNPSTVAATRAAPTGLWAAPAGLPTRPPNNTSLTLHWNNVAGASSYEVKLGANRTWTRVAPSTGSVTSHEFSDLTPDTEYTLHVRANHSDGKSDWVSLSATTLP